MRGTNTETLFCAKMDVVSAQKYATHKYGSDLPCPSYCSVQCRTGRLMAALIIGCLHFRERQSRRGFLLSHERDPMTPQKVSPGPETSARFQATRFDQSARGPNTSKGGQLMRLHPPKWTHPRPRSAFGILGGQQGRGVRCSRGNVALAVVIDIPELNWELVPTSYSNRPLKPRFGGCLADQVTPVVINRSCFPSPKKSQLPKLGQWVGRRWVVPEYIVGSNVDGVE